MENLDNEKIASYIAKGYTGYVYALATAQEFVEFVHQFTGESKADISKKIQSRMIKIVKDLPSEIRDALNLDHQFPAE